MGNIKGIEILCVADNPYMESLKFSVYDLKLLKEIDIYKTGI